MRCDMIDESYHPFLIHTTIVMVQETKKYDEDYLNGLIAKAKKSWEGVDVDSYMSDLRNNEAAEKEQKSTEGQI